MRRPSLGTGSFPATGDGVRARDLLSPEVDQRPIAARALAFLFACGGTVVLTLAIAHQVGDRRMLTIVGAVALPVVAVLVSAARRMRWPALHAVLVLGIALITLCVYFSQGRANYATFYVGVGVYACYFFSGRAAAAHIVGLAVTYAVLLAFGPATPAPFARWLVLVGTTAVMSLLVGHLVRSARRAGQSYSDRLQEQIADLEVVAGVARDLAAVTKPGAARAAVCKAAVQLTGASMGILYEADRRGLELVASATYATPERAIRLPFAGPPSAPLMVYSSGEALFVPDVRSHPGGRQSPLGSMGAVSALWQPILRESVPVGVLCVGWDTERPDLTHRVATLMRLLASEAAVAIDRADLLDRLEAVARTDDLTGLANRRAWEEALPREQARAAREGDTLCVAMLDLDHFKAYNDEHGHPAGDRQLKQVAAAWRDALRPSDLLVRYGGEEFALLLPKCPRADGIEVIERLRTMTPRGQTCSAGVAEWNREETAAELVARADRALYDAKAWGRDRSVAAG